MAQNTKIPFPPVIYLESLNRINGFTIEPIPGYAVSGVGDINSDGIDDMLIGIPGTSFVVFGCKFGFPESFNLNNINGKNGFMITGGISYINTISVSGVGDVNADGIDDLIIGAESTWVGDENYVGQSYVVFGSKHRWFPESIDINNLDGTNGFIINGISYGDHSGSSVSGAGDINADGIDDIIIGTGGYNAKQSYVVFGSQSGFPAVFNLTSLNGLNGFTINASSNELAVSGAGDINADGIDDIIIGAYNAGQSYVIFGSQYEFPAIFNLTNLNGANGFTINGVWSSGGYAVSGAGDVNGDGIDDIIIGAPEIMQSYIVFGSPYEFPAVFDVASLNGTNGFIITDFDGSFIGASVSRAGDVNADGIYDIILSAPIANNQTGGCYVVFGNQDGFPAVLNVESLDGTNGFAVNGIYQYEYTGYSASGAGDVNGDGIDDIIIGSRDADSYIIYGRGLLVDESMADIQ